MSKKGLFDEIQDAIDESRLCEIVFSTGVTVIAYMTELNEIAKEPMVFIHDVERVNTGYCPIKFIVTIKNKEKNKW